MAACPLSDALQAPGAGRQPEPVNSQLLVREEGRRLSANRTPSSAQILRRCGALLSKGGQRSQAGVARNVVRTCAVPMQARAIMVRAHLTEFNFASERARRAKQRTHHCSGANFASSAGGGPAGVKEATSPAHADVDKISIDTASGDAPRGQLSCAGSARDVAGGAAADGEATVESSAEGGPGPRRGPPPRPQPSPQWCCEAQQLFRGGRTSAARAAQRSGVEGRHGCHPNWRIAQGVARS